MSDDPPFVAPKGFVIQTVSDYGTANENIARIVMQTLQMAEASNLTQKAKEELFPALIDIAFRLANAQSAALDLRQRSLDMFNNLKEKHEDQPNGAMEIPFVPALHISFEGYFYNAKNILRELLTGPFTVIYGKRFTEASSLCAGKNGAESEVAKFLRRREKERAGYSTVRELIEQFRVDIQSIVKIRNAIEHPGGFSGTVRVENWKATPTGLREPAYYFEEDPSKVFNLIETLVGFHEVLLNLCETTIVFGLMFRLHPGLGILGIGKDKRDPAMPMAFRVVQVTPGMESQSKPFTGKAG